MQGEGDTCDMSKVCHESFCPFDWKEGIKNEENLNKIPLLQLKGWGFNPALREAFNKLQFYGPHLRGKRTVRADRI